MATTAGNRVP